MEYDVIIIGSGLGGLSCGAALSTQGKRVLVLEKHHSVGGYIQGFQRKHWHWNVGVHYVSNFESSKTISNIFKALTDSRVTFEPLDTAYERIRTDDNVYEVLSNDNNAYLHQLQREFPSERLSLDRFFKLLRTLRRRNDMLFAPKLFSGVLKFLLYGVNRLLFFPYWRKTVQQILDRYFTDDRLKLLLATHCDKLILNPEAASFLTWSVINNSYLDGACFPKGGGQAITTALTDKINANNGCVRVNAEVKELLIDKKRISGVRLCTGEEILCNRVVSDVGVLETAETLMPKGHISPRQRKIMNRYVPSAAYMTLHIGFEGDLSKFQIENTNYRIYGTAPFDFSQTPLDERWKPQNLIILFPSIRDKSHTDDRHHAAEIICPVQYAHFAQWAATRANRRGDIYAEHKRRITEKLIAAMERWFPGISRYIAFTDLSTPLTFEHYTGHKTGAAYGLSSSVGKITDLGLHPISDVKGLYYTGGDALAHGINGVFISGIFTAVALSKRLRLFTLKPSPGDPR